MASTNAAKHYQRIIARWPKDPIRPVSVASVLQGRISKTGHVSATAAGQDDPKEARNVRALYALLENRLAKKYPVSESMMRPQSNPTHYEDLLQELQAAPERSWLQRKLNSWKGFLRLS